MTAACITHWWRKKARDAWQAKHKHAHDKLVDRVRKANKQREQQQLPSWVVPSLEDWIAAGFPLEIVRRRKSVP